MVRSQPTLMPTAKWDDYFTAACWSLRWHGASHQSGSRRRPENIMVLAALPAAEVSRCEDIHRCMGFDVG